MRSTRDILLGIVFFGGIGVLAFATVALSGWSLRAKPRIVVTFENARGLKEGDAVRVVGTRFGRVREVTYDEAAPPGRRVAVLAELDDVVVLREGYEIVIEPASALGGRVLEIDPGPPTGNPIPLDALHQGSSLEDALTAMAEFFSKNEAGVRRSVDAIAAVAERIERGEGTLGRLVNDPRPFDDLVAVAGDVREIVDGIAAGRGTLGQFVTNETAYANFSAAASSIRNLAEGAERGEGTLGKLLRDEALAAEFTETVSSIRDITASLSEGRGSLGKLISDDRLYVTWTELGEDVRAVARSLREGRGVLGRLLVDEEMGRQLEVTLRAISRQIEDAREAAPIATFAGVLFGVL